MRRTACLTFSWKRYGREGIKVVSVSSGDWDARVVRWIWPSIKEYEKSSSLNPPNLTAWDSLRHGIPGLAQVRSWGNFASIPLKKLDVENVRDLFMDIDDTFHRLWGADRGALRSSTLRRFLLHYLLECRPDGSLSRVKGSFTPKGRANYQPRALISDQVSYQGGNATQAPIGALPHDTVANLKASQTKRLTKDLQRISDACVEELVAYDKACAVLDEIRTSAMDEGAERRALRKISNYKSTMSERAATLTRKEQEALIAHYLRLDSDPTAPVSAVYDGGEALAIPLAGAMGILPERFLRCVRYAYYPRQTVLVAAIVLIQIEAAWNIGSVMDMPASNIRALDGGRRFLIQSIKSKTKDDTPQVLIEGNDNPAVKALRFALSRLDALKARGWADASEGCLWLSPRSNLSARGLPISNLSKGLHELIAKYELPRFTFEQIRVQKLTLVSVEKGPIAAAEMAGHSTFATIGGYIDHLITRRVNSAINLEFQKRWEDEHAQRIAYKSVRLPLIPIGDGSTCVDPAAPPKEAWLEAGVCSAVHCHDGEGCPRRKLVIDKARVQEVLLTKRYYVENWQRLYASNPESFAQIHMPRIEFNLYLHEFLKRGPYRHLING